MADLGLDVALGTLTADEPALDVSATWNNTGVTFTILKANITDTASVGLSKFLDMQNGGVSKARIFKEGSTAWSGQGHVFGSAVADPDGTVALIRLAQGPLTTDTRTIQSEATWNAGAIAFTAWRLNITDTASAAASLLLDLQVGGTSKLAVVKDGKPNFGGPTQATVGAAGAASALPANPTGYLRIQVAGAERVIPYYAQA